MNIVYRCVKCGWQKEGVELSDLLTCPRCNEPILVDIYKGKDDIANLIEEDEIEQMKLAIQQDGNDTIWKDIETIKSPYARAEERKLFIKAGGIIPEKEIKI